MSGPFARPLTGREQRRQLERDAAKQARPGRRKPRDTFNPVVMTVGSVLFRERFDALKREADQQCIASDNVPLICDSAGRLLFVTLRALELLKWEIEESDVVQTLTLMACVLGDALESDSIDRDQRACLMQGMDYLCALVEPMPLAALGAAWWHLDEKLRTGHFCTDDVRRLLRQPAAPAP